MGHILRHHKLNFVALLRCTLRNFPFSNIRISLRLRHYETCHERFMLSPIVDQSPHNLIGNYSCCPIAPFTLLVWCVCVYSFSIRYDLLTLAICRASDRASMRTIFVWKTKMVDDDTNCTRGTDTWQTLNSCVPPIWFAFSIIFYYFFSLIFSFLVFYRQQRIIMSSSSGRIWYFWNGSCLCASVWTANAWCQQK